MYNSKVTHSVGGSNSELSCRMKTIQQNLRGTVREEAALAGMPALGYHGRYQLLEMFYILNQVVVKYKCIHMSKLLSCTIETSAIYVLLYMCYSSI